MLINMSIIGGDNMSEREEYITKFISNELSGVPFQLNDNLKINGEIMNERDEFIILKSLIDVFIEGNKLNRYIVMPGLRGVGKTTLLYQSYDYLLNEKNVSPNQIFLLSCEDLNDFVSCDLRELIEIFLDKFHNKTLRTLEKDIFLLIDEAQYDKNWSKDGKIIYDKTKHVFMIFTGSSALHLEYNADSARRMVKKTIPPLNYTQHLKLKYGLSFNGMSDSLKGLLFEGDVDAAIEYERKTNDALVNFVGYTDDDWMEYVNYGGFPTLFEENDYKILSGKLVDLTKKIINTDLLNFKNFSSENQANANRILKFLALQKPGEASQPKLTNHLRTSAANVKSILDMLEKTQIIFHCEPYGESSKRIKKSWKYYFATSSLRNVLAREYGTSLSQSEHEGTIFENLVAANLFSLSNNLNELFSVYYDGNSKKNVDFIVQKNFDKMIPIEVGRGKKNQKQMNSAMNRFDCEYGIIVSNRTNVIEKHDEIIYVPLKTFSFL